MDCTRCEELLLQATEASLDASDRAELDRHLGQCPHCGELARLLSAEADGSLEIPAGLAEAVLARTGDDDRLAGVLKQLERDLQMLASMEVDGAFVDDVMAATVIADRRHPARLLAAWWQRLVQRPRFALEGAYVAALVVLLLVGLPSSPLAALPRSALERLGNDQGAVRVISTSARWVTDLGRDTWSEAGRLLTSDDGLSASARVDTLVDSAFDRAARWIRAWLDSARESVRRLLAWLVAFWGEAPDDGGSDDRFPSASQPERTARDRLHNPA